MEEKIRALLTLKTPLESELCIERKYLDRDPCDAERHDLVDLEIKCALLSGMLSVLNEDERFVITKHLIDETEWTRVVVAFAEKWGAEYGKSLRTLVYYQGNAFKKMEHFIRKHQNKFDKSFPEIMLCTLHDEKTKNVAEIAERGNI